MDMVDILLLGGLAGATIFLGLPIARLQRLTPRAGGFLNAAAVGVLVFLVVEVVKHAAEPVEEAVVAAARGGPTQEALLLEALLVAGFFVGMLSLPLLDRRLFRNTVKGPVAAAWMIAAGIGLHNFSEGLAIGASAATGAIGLAVLLVIGFALHNATEGFGIAAPLAGSRPSWKLLALLGILGGGPTFLGTIVGSAATLPELSLLFLALAAGALLYVIALLLAQEGRRMTLAHASPMTPTVLAAGLAVGFLFAYWTELVLVLGGGG